jgi:uncharacterized protein involved in exopolysaccharide biosynthesis
VSSLEATSQTYSEIIRSRAIVENVVRTLRLDEDDPDEEKSFLDPVRESFASLMKGTSSILKYGRIVQETDLKEAVDRVQEDLSVAPTENSFVFEITYTGSDPEECAAIANTAADEFVRQNHDAYRAEAQGAREFIEGRLSQSGADLGAARRELQQFMEQYKVADFEEERSSRVPILADFESELETTRGEISGTRAEIDEIAEQLSHVDPLQTSRTTTNNPLVTELRSTLADLEVRRAGLLRTLTPAHPEVGAVDAEILEIRSRLERETSRMPGDEESSSSTVYQELLTARLLAQARLESLLAREGSLVATVAQQKQELAEFANLEPKLAELKLSAEEDTHRLIRQAYEEARIREAGKLSEIRVVSPAVVPTNPSGPIRILWVGVALVTSLGVGVGLALFLEYIDLSIRDVEGAERALSVPVLATIPNAASTSLELRELR